MSQATNELREIVAEQVYRLHAARAPLQTPWARSEERDRLGAYRDADSIVSLFVVREACLQAEIARQRTNADAWRKRAQTIEADLWAARDRPAPREKSPAKVPEPVLQLAPQASVIPSAVSVASALPTDKAPIQKNTMKIDLIDEAVNLLRSIVAAEEAGVKAA